MDELNIFQDRKMRDLEARIFGILCQLDRGDGITDVKDRLAEILDRPTGYFHRSLVSLLENGYIRKDRGDVPRLFRPKKVFVDPQAREASGFPPPPSPLPQEATDPPASNTPSVSDLDPDPS
ncbi:MAG: hypothetical protein QGI83_18245 [Candidatus Latescibacteria bacterium]|jgi:hypothetical protein|nr:hypothetical protein [Candidatus Latescibacterota bacterium]